LVEKGYTIVQDPPRHWLDILFCDAPWEQGTGLHIRQEQMTPHLGYAIGLVYGENTCIGGGLNFVGVEFFMLLALQR
jgi:hypothetical protein